MGACTCWTGAVQTLNELLLLFWNPLCAPPNYICRPSTSPRSPFRCCQALSSSLQVRHLTVIFEEVESTRIDILRKALEENGSLKSVALNECGSEGAAVLVAEGLRANTSVTDMMIDCYQLVSPFMRSLGRMIAINENLNSVQLVCDEPLPTLGVKFLSEGVVQNGYITDFAINVDTPVESMTAIMAALKQNTVWLHHAVRFALGRNRGKQCAEAFELLSSRPYFVAKMMMASGMAEAEAKAALEAAKLFVWHNYLLINKVFRDKLECHAGNGVQIDQLNFDCWLAITKYLNVSDIVFE